jgi:hypothetical protein
MASTSRARPQVATQKFWDEWTSRMYMPADGHPPAI